MAIRLINVGLQRRPVVVIVSCVGAMCRLHLTPVVDGMLELVHGRRNQSSRHESGEQNYLWHASNGGHH